MWKFTLGITLICTVASSAGAQGLTSLTCSEVNGGWCESDGKCYQNSELPREFIFNMVRLPVDGETAAGTLTECKVEKCGREWAKEVSSYGGNYVVRGHEEIYMIDGKTGFFTQTTILSGLTIGRVSHAFGYCKLPSGN